MDTTDYTSCAEIEEAKKAFFETKRNRKTLFHFIGACPASWGTPVGGSPTMVITSEPYSQIRCVVVIQGTKRMGNVAS